MYFAAAIKLIGGTRATVWFALMLAFATATGVQSCRIKPLNDKIDKQKSEIAQWKVAQDDNLRAIKALGEANSIWKTLAERDDKANAEAVKRLAEEKAAIALDLEAAREELEILYAKNPAARAWANRGIPSSVSDRLLAD